MRLLGLQLLPFYFYEREFTNDSRLHFCNGLPPGDGMANFKLLIGASLLVVAFGSHAGYAQVTPPAAVAGATVKTGTAGLSWINNAVRFNGSLNIGGRAITVPAAMRFAANAPRIIASAIVLNPYIRTAVTVASLLQIAKVEWDEANQTWVKKEVIPGGTIFYSGDRAITFPHTDPWSACLQYANLNWGYVFFGSKVIQYGFNQMACWDDNHGVWYYIPEKSIATAQEEKYPLTNEEAENLIYPLPFPNDLPNDLPPGIAIPVEPTPIINPVPDPQVNPVTRPLREPLGEPVPVPNTDPQQWKTPVIDVVAAPLPDQPWRVDIQPRDIVKNDPSPITDPQVVNQEPSGQTQQEKTPGLCDMYPDILACQKPNLDTPTIDQIQTKDAVITITPDSGWGADNAACPAPRHLSAANSNFEFDLLCQFMTGIRPVIIAIAWLSAAMILIGFKRGE